MKRTRLNYHYSGPQSRKFWAVVNTLPKSKWNAAYALGVALQNLEVQVLREIENAARGTVIQKR